MTRAWMSLPGKEPAPSLPESHTEIGVPQRREGWGMSVGWDYLTVSSISRLETPRKCSTLCLTSPAKPPETIHRQKWSERPPDLWVLWAKRHSISGEPQSGSLAAFSLSM